MISETKRTFSQNKETFFPGDKMDTFLSAGGSDLFIFLKSEQRALCRGSLRSSVSGLCLSLKLLFILMFSEMETFCLFFWSLFLLYVLTDFLLILGICFWNQVPSCSELAKKERHNSGIYVRVL